VQVLVQWVARGVISRIRGLVDQHCVHGLYIRASKGLDIL
jgi:hypothetical protein